MSDTARAIREGLVANLRTIDGDQLVSGGLQILPYVVSNPRLPTLWILPGAVTYDETFQRGQDKEMWRVQALMGSALEEASQMLLDALRAPTGATSVKAAVEQKDDQLGRRVTLAGAVHDCRVISSTGFLPVDGAMFGHPGVPLSSCDWLIEATVRP